MSALSPLTILAETLRIAVPYACAAMAGVVSERSGVVNVALEGMLLGGAFGAAAVAIATGSAVLGVAGGVALGALLAWVHASVVVRLRVDGIVSGLAVNLLAAAGTRFSLRALYGSSSNSPHFAGFAFGPEGASGAASLARVLADPLLWLAALASLGCAWMLSRTRFGRHLVACGESPETALAVGIDLAKVRVAAVCLAGAVAALGGAHLAFDQRGFESGMTGGRGFLALAVVVLSGWRLGRALLGCVAFAALKAVAIALQDRARLPHELLQTVPYLATLLALALLLRGTGAPAGLGKDPLIPMPTEKLYWSDPHATKFRARVVSLASYEGRPSVVLDRTLFYPEAGGQLADRGSLVAGAAPRVVADVQVDGDGTIHHLLEGDAADLAPGTEVSGEIDRVRRRDFMSQHTGQHMLSRALLDVLRAETVSARLGATDSTIDLGVPSAADAALARAEDLANSVVLDDRAIRALFPTPEELAAMPLRREPKVDRGVRVIDIDGFDLSPCGGTHCLRTGEVGPLRITGVERYKGNTRVTFLAGTRALADYRAKDEALAELARAFSCGPLDVAAGVGKLRADLKSRGDALAVARGELTRFLAESILAAHPPAAEGTTWVRVLRDGDDPAVARTLANRLAARPDVVAFVATRERPGADWQLVVERGASATVDAGAWWKRCLAPLGAKGGGRAERAEGRVPGTVDLAAVG